MTVSVSGAVVSFTTTASTRAVARSTITTTDTATLVTFRFEIARNPLVLRVGTTAGDQDIVSNLLYEPGIHTISFIPGVATYYFEFELRNVGKATMSNFTRLAAADFEIATPWGADFNKLRLHQSLNVVYMAHADYESRVLERRGTTSWTLRYLRPDDGPFGLLNATDIMMTPSAQTGEVTITASQPAFITVDVDSLLRLTHAGQFVSATMGAAEAATDAVRVSGIEASRVFQYAITGTWVGTIVLERAIGNEVNFETVATHTTNVSTSYDDDLDNQIAYYRLRMTAYTSGSASASITHSQGVTDGTARIVSVNADNAVTADVISPFAKTTATPLWYRGEWSGRYGWPTAVGMFDGRLALVRSDQYWMSRPDEFESFEVGAEDDSAISRTLTGRMNIAKWVAGVRRLLVGTTGSEHIVTAGELGEVITPVNVYSRAVKTRGSAEASPVIIDEYVVMISRSNKRIYMIRNIGGEEYEAIDLTRLHPQIGGATGFKEIAFQAEPEPRLWAVRNDGVMAVLLLNPEEEIAAWSRITTDGSFESVAVRPTTGEEDEVWFMIDRPSYRDTTERYIEKLAPESYSSLTQAQRLHSAVVYSGTATTTITGLDHLDGASVHAWADGRESGPYTVASGQITLDYSATYAVVGLKYTGQYKSPRLDWGAQAGTALTQHKQVKALGLMIRDTPGGQLRWGRDFLAANMQVLHDRHIGDSYDTALSGWTFDDVLAFEGKQERDARICIEMHGAGPATVLGIVPVIQTNES